MHSDDFIKIATSKLAFWLRNLQFCTLDFKSMLLSRNGIENEEDAGLQTALKCMEFETDHVTGPTMNDSVSNRRTKMSEFER